MTCNDDGTLWCPERKECISTCEADCECEVGTTDSSTITSTTTSIITESSTTDNEYSTTPEGYCNQICFGETDGNHGDCCEETYCYCESYGNYELTCNVKDTLFCPKEGKCIENCQTDCEECQGGWLVEENEKAPSHQDPDCDMLCEVTKNSLLGERFP